MAQIKTTLGGGRAGRGASSVLLAFFMFLARELARPRFRSFLVMALFIVLLLRQHMPMIGSEVGVNNGLGHGTPTTSSTTTTTTTTTSTAPLATTTAASVGAKQPNNQQIYNADNNNNKPPTVMTSTPSLSLKESKTQNTRLYNRNNSNTNTIPRTIYIFWSSGWPSDRVETQLVRKSWEYFNHGYTVHCLDFDQAELLTDRRRYIPDSVFDKMKVQARSDVYRTLILHRHGGIWVDASLFCNMPLDHWLDLNQTDLISFVRHDKLDKQRQLNIKPWITSWFLAAPKGSYIISQVVKIISNATEQKRRLNKKRDYFWWHRIVSDLARRDDYIMNRIQTLFVSANPMHCHQEGYETMAPVLKRCGNNKMYSTFATAHVCCTQTTSAEGQGNAVHANHNVRRDIYKMAQATANLTKNTMTTTHWNNFCASWNCTMHSRNMHRIDEFKVLYGNETFGKLPFILYSD